MNHLTLTDAEMKLLVRFVVRGVKGSDSTVTMSEADAAQSLLNKALNKACEVLA